MAIFQGVCPNCHGEISDGRLKIRNPCCRCLSKEIIKKDLIENIKEIYFALKKEGKVLDYEKIYKEFILLDEFERFFESCVNNKLWSVQRNWAFRVLRGESFAIVSPTGTGKTTLAAALSVFLARKFEKTIYFIVPTTTLVRQVASLIEKFGLFPLYYYSGMRKKEKDAFQERLLKNSFEILITTSQFLSRNFDILKGIHFDIIFVDDIDALLRTSKNIDRVLQLIGFSQEDISLAMEVIKSKRKLLRAKKGEILNILKEIKEIKRKLEKKEKKGQIILMSATARPRGTRPKLFRELLNFQIGESATGMRNIVDAYFVTEDLDKALLEVIKKLGNGGLIFVARDFGEEKCKQLKTYLNQHGIKADTLLAGEKLDKIDLFREGEIDILIGSAHFYGVLVRGLDLPERVRYTVFYEIPRFKLKIEEALLNPFFFLYFTDEILKIKEEKELREIASNIEKFLTSVSPNAIRMLVRELKSNIPEKFTEIIKKIKRGKEIIQNLLSDPEVKKGLKEAKSFIFSPPVVVFPDVNTYIQASGRCSRLYAGGLTKGLSIILTTNEKNIKLLERRLRWKYDIIFRKLKELKLSEILEEIDKDRKKVKMIKEGKLKSERKDPVKTILLVVESPTKARTIANFFGKPCVRIRNGLRIYETSTGDMVINIVATKGHLFDLITNQYFHGVKRINNLWIPIYATIRTCKKCGEQFVGLLKCPRCGSETYSDAWERIKTIQEIAKEVDLVLIGTDADAEGEKIGWDIACAIAPFSREIKRVEFHEITERAILSALRNPRDINLKLVEAQIVRRIEDRWIGFELSEEVQREKVGYSAGRVQTPVLKWIIERYKERKNNMRFYLDIEIPIGLKIEFELPSKIKDKEDAESFADQIEEIEVEKIKEWEEILNPLPPFETNTLISEASRSLGWDSKTTMRIAQDLFELGFITYHRTDSIRVAPEGIGIAKYFIKDKFGETYFKGRSWGTGGAHECIRPTRGLEPKEIIRMIGEGLLPRLTKKHIRLYSLIFWRFIASQMIPCKVLYGEFKIRAGPLQKIVRFPIKILDEGWLRATPVISPVPVVEGKVTILRKRIRKDSPISLYTDGTLVQEMKKRGIGRPSTYATILSKLKQRYYVIDKHYLIPTSTGEKLVKYLYEKYPKLVDEKRTRELEEKMRKIEEGKINYQDVLNELYEELRSLGLFSQFRESSS